jgi:deoxycytidylate deaminase
MKKIDVKKFRSKRTTSLDSSLNPENPELVFGLVGAIGTNLDGIEQGLRIALSEVGYKVATPIRLSEKLHTIQKFQKLSSIRDQEERYTKHMNAGDTLRKTLQRNDAMALLGIYGIQSARIQLENTSDGRRPISRGAYILHSLKRPEEVQTLRQIYGDTFHLIAAYSSKSHRQKRLSERLYQEGAEFASASEAIPAAMELINRDENDRYKQYGQSVQETFPLADVFVDADIDATSAIRRFIHLLFRHPCITPTKEEYCMFHAQGAALRSAEPGRQVGSAISTEDGQIIAIGTNEVAKAGGGQYWEGDPGDARELKRGQKEDSNTKLRNKMLKDLFDRMQAEGWFKKRSPVSDSTIRKLLPKIKGARILDIIEYMRAVHAEMASLTDAARKGLTTLSCTMYVTTFPCHECAKHIVASGIRKVIYIEPYAKSQVTTLFEDSICVEQDCNEARVIFQPFVGVAPRRYMAMFVMSSRKNSTNGLFLNWEEGKSFAQPKFAGSVAAYTVQEDIAVAELVRKLQQHGLSFADNKPGARSTS